MSRQTSWTAADLDFDRSRYPVIPTVRIVGPLCPASGPVGHRCTRPEGHTGRHLARGYGGTVHAVWGDLTRENVETDPEGAS